MNGSSGKALSRVVWTVRARRKLEQALAPTIIATKDAPSMFSKRKIAKRLKESFPDRGVVVVVQDLYVGFRPRADRFIVLVEVTGGDDPGPRIVKLGSSEALQGELSAWEACRPYGLRQDLVLMSLMPCYRDGKLISLIYGDAKQSIGVDTTCSLEEAVRNATLYGTPSVLSIRFALIQLYERLGQLMHAFAADDERNQASDGPHLEYPRLWESLRRWGATFRATDTSIVRSDLIPRELPLAIRRRPSNSDRPEYGFRDPVDYLARFVKPFTTWRVLLSETKKVNGEKSRSTVDLLADAEARLADGSQPLALKYIPTLRRGRVHGDLHGRNIQVGIAGDQVHWPSVFDFESMQQKGLIGLDFVKLETELKIRVLPLVFDPPSPSNESLHLQEFEYGLNKWAESTLSKGYWPRLEDLADSQPPDSTPHIAASHDETTAKRLARLRTILLEIRRLAAIALGKRSGRPNDWLREYLFLQLCYGVTTVRFENLTDRELTCAFIAAGIAAGWLFKSTQKGIGKE